MNPDTFTLGCSTHKEFNSHCEWCIQKAHNITCKLTLKGKLFLFLYKINMWLIGKIVK